MIPSTSNFQYQVSGVVICIDAATETGTASFSASMDMYLPV